MKHAILFAAAAALTACSAPESGQDADEIETPEAQQREMVEDEVRRVYEAEGAEVTEVTMERTEDGSEFRGIATVRDPETGTEIRVDCVLSANRRGAQDLECDQRDEQEEEAS